MASRLSIVLTTMVSMEECPNCGSTEMMWASEDSDGTIWFYCLNDGCVDLHPHGSDQDKAVLDSTAAGAEGEEE